MSDGKAPIIIKKVKKVSGGGHHGGAWKVAYADFVTAMMAFFLLMWLLSATTEEQRQGIADYFRPDIPLSETSGGGDGFMNGDSVIDTRDLAHSATAELDYIEHAMKAATDGEDSKEGITEHIAMTVTREGLVIEIVDLAGKALFRSGSAEPTPLMTEIVATLAPIIATLRNRVGVDGHTDAEPFTRADGYGNWDLSVDRAAAARRLLERFGLPEEHFIKVSGHAATDPYVTDPLAPQNRRIAITLFRAGRHGLVPESRAPGAY